MNYTSMADELEKIAISPAFIARGVYKGLLGRGLKPQKAMLGARQTSFLRKTKQRPKALGYIKSLRTALPKAGMPGTRVPALRGAKGMRSAPMPKVQVAA